MKLEILYHQNNNQKLIPSIVRVSVNDETDYKILNRLIKKDDIIEKRIRKKDKVVKNRFYYINISLIIDEVEYIEEPTETIHLTGKITKSDFENIKEGCKQSIWITDGCEFCIIKEEWNQDEIKILEEIINYDETKPNYKTHASPRELQHKCFDVLHKYIAKKFSYVIYGKETLSALENGSIKVLFVTEEFIDKQADNYKYALTTENHQFHGANIVIYDKGTDNWQELTNYGGIIGVLKYEIYQQNE